MPLYSDEILDEVRSRNDIVDVIGQYVKLKKSGSTYFGLCPFHNEKTPSFSVSPRKQMFYCFGCGAGGNVITFLRDYENYTFQEAVKVLADRAGIALPEHTPTAEERREAGKRERLLEIQKEAATYFYRLLRSPRGERALAYFRERGLTDETLQKFGLGYADQYSDDLYRYLKEKGYPDGLLKESGLCGFDEKRGGHDRFWNRAMFPIQDIHGKVIGFGGRVMGEGEPKYLNSPETPVFDKSRNLYALHLARKSREDALLLCEGYMDVIALHQAGFDNAVASLGTSYTEGHAALLKRTVSQVYLTFDSDGAGIRAALRAIPICRRAGLLCRVIDLKPYKDPDEFIKNLGADAFRERIRDAEGSFAFEIRQLSLQFDQKQPEEKTRFQHALASRIAAFPDELERENYILSMGEAYQIPTDALRRLVQRIGSEGGITKKPPPPEREEQRRVGMDRRFRPQAVLLTALASDEKAFSEVEHFLSEEDFTEEPYRETAVLLFAQLREGRCDPAAILDRFQDEADQHVVAALFHTDVKGLAEEEDREAALFDAMLQVKQESIRIHAGTLDPSDIKAQQKIFQDKLLLEELKTKGRNHGNKKEDG